MCVCIIAAKSHSHNNYSCRRSFSKKKLFVLVFIVLVLLKFCSIVLGTLLQISRLHFIVLCVYVLLLLFYYNYYYLDFRNCLMSFLERSVVNEQTTKIDVCLSESTQNREREREEKKKNKKCS